MSKEAKTTEKTTEKKEAANVLALREAMSRAVAYSKESGVTFTQTEGGNIYNEHLPEGITPEIVKQVHGYDRDFIAESARVASKVFISAFKEDDELNNIALEVPMQVKTDKVQIMGDRKDGLSVAHVTSVCNARAGQLKKIFNSFEDELKEAFGQD